jgi:uncharacterized protein (DUF983 family)
MRVYEETEENGEIAEVSSGDGITMECMCPRCGITHRLKILWAGRGKPKKFCQACKMYIATLETVELPCLPVSVNRVVG